jgi:hypothetical protein
MAMRWSALALVLLVLSGCKPSATPPQAASGADLAHKPAAAAPVVHALRPQPKPGERVRQPELDSYCAESRRSLAFYYHGGSPVVQVAQKDDCAPLYLSECEQGARCFPPRDQEPGMWCCGAPRADLPVHAER